MKKVILIIIVIIFSFAITTITLNAHSEIVNVKYDNCEFDEINNKWYTLDLIDEEDYIDHLLHVPENLIEIKYYIHDNGLDNDNYTWTTDIDEKIANEIKQTYIESMKKWNDVYYYSYEEYGNIIENKIINITEASNQSESNLDIFPCYMQEGDYIACVMQNSYPETIHDTVNISHYHCNKWNMNVNIYYFVESFYNNINGVEINKQKNMELY